MHFCGEVSFECSLYLCKFTSFLGTEIADQANSFDSKQVVDKRTIYSAFHWFECKLWEYFRVQFVVKEERRIESLDQSIWTNDNWNFAHFELLRPICLLWHRWQSEEEEYESGCWNYQSSWKNNSVFQLFHLWHWINENSAKTKRCF